MIQEEFLVLRLQVRGLSLQLPAQSLPILRPWGPPLEQLARRLRALLSPLPLVALPLNSPQACQPQRADSLLRCLQLPLLRLLLRLLVRLWVLLLLKDSLLRLQWMGLLKSLAPLAKFLRRAALQLGRPLLPVPLRRSVRRQGRLL